MSMSMIMIVTMIMTMPMIISIFMIISMMMTMTMSMTMFCRTERNSLHSRGVSSKTHKQLRDLLKINAE